MNETGTWLCLQIGGPFGRCSQNKSPAVSGVFKAPWFLGTPTWFDGTFFLQQSRQFLLPIFKQFAIFDEFCSPGTVSGTLK